MPDLSNLVEVAGDVVDFLKPYLPALAKAGGVVATGIGRKIGADAWDKTKTAVPKMIKTVWNRVWGKADNVPSLSKALETAAADPDNRKVLDALRDEILDALKSDPDFKKDVTKTVKKIRKAVAKGDRSVAPAGDLKAPATTGDGSPIFNQQGQTVHGDQTQAGRDAVKARTYIRKVEHAHFTAPSSAPTVAVSALHQLPAPPADFTGREGELAQLRDAIKKGSVLISGLRGMGGIGKSALALKLADELKNDYPDAQVYLDLRGTAANKDDHVTPAKAMEHVIRAFAPDARLPEGETEIAAAYRSVLSDKRALLLMDNAFDARQVAPLVPPAGNFLLVTSREHISLPGLTSKRLDTLPPNEAKDLLLKVAPRIADKAAALAKACGFLPLALRLAATALERHPTVSVDSYLERLADAATRTKEFAEPALAASYDLLSDELKVIWRRLAVFPSTFDAAAVGSVCEVAKDAAHRLGDLVASSLVECDEGTRRCRLHDLARDFAASKLGDCPQWRFLKRRGHVFASILGVRF